MKVREVNVYVIGTIGFRPVVIEIITDEGIVGLGEAAVGFGAGCYAAGHLAADLAQRFVVGRDPANITDIWNDFYYHTFWGKGAGAIFYSAVSALEHALWDIKGRTLSVPVYQLLGGKQRDKIRVYANGWSEGKCVAAEEFAEKAVKVVEDGFSAIKTYPLSKIDPINHTNLHLKNRVITKEEYKRCIDAIRLIREAVGPDIDLLIDVTAEGTTDIMTKIGREIEQYDIFWYEEAMDAFDVDAYREIKAKVNIPLATGERFYTRYGFRPLIESRAVDIVQPDPGTCGGILEALYIGAAAETHSMRIAPHNCGGPVLTAVAIQLAATLSNFVIQETFPYHTDQMLSIVTDPFERKIKKGWLDVPTAPGLGVDLNHEIIDKFRIATVVADQL
jgi:galactonate dehydratase